VEKRDDLRAYSTFHAHQTLATPHTHTSYFSRSLPASQQFPLPDTHDRKLTGLLRL